jgi:CRP-like cAMP-binding protein/SAM-dependent methyltransferase
MNALFELLPEYITTWMVRSGSERRLDPGEVLIREGTRPAAMSIVLEGLLSVHGWADQRMGIAGPGQIVGEMSFIDDTPASVTVIADEPSLLLEITHLQLRAMVEADHAFGADLYRALAAIVAERLREANLALFAAETLRQRHPAPDPDVQKVQAAIDEFKELLLQLDKEALKSGAVSEENARKFLGRSFVLMHLLHRVIGTASPLPAAAREDLGRRLQREMLPYVLTAGTAERFYSKPRGYAGDYLAIDGIYRNEPRGTGRLGPLIDRMFLATPPSVAVRNRRTLLADEIVRTVRSANGRAVRILCLASGPASEVFDAFAALESPAALSVTLLDIDAQALAFVEEECVRRSLGDGITLRKENLIALFLGRATLALEPFDLIYSIGLTDYLNDKLFGKLLAFAHPLLVPGGRILLGNFHPRNPAREFMDFVLDWTLIHRTEEDMNRLFAVSPFQRPSERIIFEPEGVDLFAECSRS